VKASNLLAVYVTIVVSVEVAKMVLQFPLTVLMIVVLIVPIVLGAAKLVVIPATIVISIMIVIEPVGKSRRYCK
jgi:hypothetical protein